MPTLCFLPKFCGRLSDLSPLCIEAIPFTVGPLAKYAVLHRMEASRALRPGRIWLCQDSLLALQGKSGSAAKPYRFDGGGPKGTRCAYLGTYSETTTRSRFLQFARGRPALVVIPKWRQAVNGYFEERSLMATSRIKTLTKTECSLA